MRYNQLGQTDLKISELCLGSMTWGTQNTEAEAFEQIDMALEAGVNIIDTAEMYPVNPLSQATQGTSERIIGTWLGQSKRRGDVLIATKVSGSGYKAVREGAPISPASIDAALNASLKSLQTDYVDLYQLHWPNRGSYMFRQNWSFDATSQDKAQTLDHMYEVLTHLQKLVDLGKIRHFGLSNESAWGMAQWLRISEDHSLPRAVSIQNEYSLMCRLFDLDLGELAHNETVSLLAFSPLAAGLLTGKYDGDVTPVGSRRSIVPEMGGRVTAHLWPALEAYMAVARKHGLDPAQMALAWCRTRPFVGSAIFGATKISQLKTALGSTEVDLSEDVMADIQTVYRTYPIPY